MSLTMEKFIFSASFGDMKCGPMEMLAERPQRCAYFKNGWYPLVATFHDDNGLEPSADLNSLFALIGKFFDWGGKLFANWKEMGEGWEKDVDKMLDEFAAQERKLNTEIQKANLNAEIEL